jgi:hypothetical protein
MGTFLTTLWSKIQLYVLAACALIITVLCVVLDFKSKSIHKLQIQVLKAKNQGEIDLLDSGVTKTNVPALKAKAAYEKSLDIYNRIHNSNK